MKEDPAPSAADLENAEAVLATYRQQLRDVAARSHERAMVATGDSLEVMKILDLASRVTARAMEAENVPVRELESEVDRLQRLVDRMEPAKRSRRRQKASDIAAIREAHEREKGAAH